MCVVTNRRITNGWADIQVSGQIDGHIERRSYKMWMDRPTGRQCTSSMHQDHSLSA